MIVINEKTIAIWYMNTTKDQDFLGSLYLDDENKPTFTYRFRYYKSNDAWDGKDKKNWYQGQPKADQPINFILNAIRTMVATMAHAAHTEYDEVLMKDGNVKQFMDEFSSKPWAHCRIEKGGEA